MKYAMLIITFLFSSVASANCMIRVSDIKYYNQDGVSDWDSKTDDLVMTFPEIEQFTGDLPELIMLKFTPQKSCPKPKKLQLRVYGFKGPYRMTGHDDNHALHGAPPQGEWLLEPILTKDFEIGLIYENTEVTLKDIPVGEIWKKVDEHFWYWSLRFDLVDPAQQHIINSKEIAAPLQH